MVQERPTSVELVLIVIIMVVAVVVVIITPHLVVIHPGAWKEKGLCEEQSQAPEPTLFPLPWRFPSAGTPGSPRRTHRRPRENTLPPFCT